jgi:hypothetical protein
MTMPITVEYAVMICEKDKLLARSQRLGDRDISGPGRTAVGFQHDVLEIAICQRVFKRARVIDNVNARESGGLATHAVEQTK